MDVTRAEFEQAIAQLQTIRHIKQDTLRQLLSASNGLLDTLDQADLTVLPTDTKHELEQKMSDLTDAITALISQIT